MSRHHIIWIGAKRQLVDREYFRVAEPIPPLNCKLLDSDVVEMNLKHRHVTLDDK